MIYFLQFSEWEPEMAQAAEKTHLQRYEHCMEHETSANKYFPSINVGLRIAAKEADGWELVSAVCEPGYQDVGLCKALLFFKRPVAIPENSLQERPSGGRMSS